MEALLKEISWDLKVLRSISKKKKKIQLVFVALASWLQLHNQQIRIDVAVDAFRKSAIVTLR